MTQLLSIATLSKLLLVLHKKMLSQVEPMCLLSQGIGALAVLFRVSFQIFRCMGYGESLMGAVREMTAPLLKLLLIALFPEIVIGGLNAVLSPLSSGTEGILRSSREKTEQLSEQYEVLLREKIQQRSGKEILLDDEQLDSKLQSMGVLDTPEIISIFLERSAYNLREKVLHLVRELLRVLYDSMTLCLNTLRTYFLLILSIVGPLSFAISIWKGFEITLPYWISKYVGVYLWLPLGNILSLIMEQIEQMVMQSDMELLSGGGSLSQQGADIFWIAFSIIGIVGYRMVPALSSWIIQCSTGERYLSGVAQLSKALVGNIRRR